MLGPLAWLLWYLSKGRAAEPSDLSQDQPVDEKDACFRLRKVLESASQRPIGEATSEGDLGYILASDADVLDELPPEIRCEDHVCDASVEHVPVVDGYASGAWVEAAYLDKSELNTPGLAQPASHLAEADCRESLVESLAGFQVCEAPDVTEAVEDAAMLDWRLRTEEKTQRMDSFFGQEVRGSLASIFAEDDIVPEYVRPCECSDLRFPSDSFLVDDSGVGDWETSVGHADRRAPIGRGESPVNVPSSWDRCAFDTPTDSVTSFHTAYDGTFSSHESRHLDFTSDPTDLSPSVPARDVEEVIPSPVVGADLRCELDLEFFDFLDDATYPEVASQPAEASVRAGGDASSTYGDAAFLSPTAQPAEASLCAGGEAPSTYGEAACWAAPGDLTQPFHEEAVVMVLRSPTRSETTTLVHENLTRIVLRDPPVASGASSPTKARTDALFYVVGADRSAEAFSPTQEDYEVASLFPNATSSEEVEDADDMFYRTAHGTRVHVTTGDVTNRIHSIVVGKESQPTRLHVRTSTRVRAKSPRVRAENLSPTIIDVKQAEPDDVVRLIVNTLGTSAENGAADEEILTPVLIAYDQAPPDMEFDPAPEEVGRVVGKLKPWAPVNADAEREDFGPDKLKKTGGPRSYGRQLEQPKAAVTDFDAIMKRRKNYVDTIDNTGRLLGQLAQRSGKMSGQSRHLSRNWAILRDCIRKKSYLDFKDKAMR